MRSILAIILSLTFAFAAVGCGGNACQDSCEKLKTCAKSMDCAGNLGCQMIKAGFEAADCGSISECSGQQKTAAEAFNSCTLDPKKNCACQ